MTEPASRLIRPFAIAWNQMLSSVDDHEDYEQLVARMERFLNGIERYQNNPYRRKESPHQVLATRGETRLLDYSQKAKQNAPCVLCLPSLINPPWIFDLRPERSLISWLDHMNIRTFMIDWGEPEGESLDFCIDTYITDRLLPLIKNIDHPVILLGYCLGGTMGLAAAQLAEPGQILGLTCLAAPWDFSAYKDEDRNQLAAYWQQLNPIFKELGRMPLEFLQVLFWSQDQDLLERKFAQIAELDGKDKRLQHLIALQEWTSDGNPVSYPAAQQIFEDFITDNKTGDNRWTIQGQQIVPSKIKIPGFCTYAQYDSLVPHGSAPKLAGDEEPTIIPTSHVSMVVGNRSQQLLWEKLYIWINALHSANRI